MRSRREYEREALVFVRGDEFDGWSSEIRPIRPGPPRLQKRRHKRQREGGDEVSSHQGSFELVARVAWELGGVAAELVEGLCCEDHDGRYGILWCLLEEKGRR